MLAGAVVLPSFLAFGQIGLPFRHAGLSHRADEQCRAEHILVLLLQGLLVFRKVEHEGAHQRVAFCRHAFCTCLYVWHQALALLKAAFDDAFGLLPVVPGLRVAHIAMHAHQRQIDTCLYPSKQPLDIGRVLVLVAGTEETACVVGPPRNTGCLHAHAGCQLAAEGLPVVAHVAAP